MQAKHTHTPKPPKGWQRVLKKWWGRLAAIIAGAALITGSLTNLESFAKHTIDSLSGNRGLPVQITSMQASGGPGDMHVMAKAVSLSSPQLTQLNALNQTTPAYKTWFANHNAVNVGMTGITFELQGNRSHTVQVTNLQPISSCQRPLRGTLFYSPPGGGVTGTEIFINLDNPHAELSYVAEQDGVSSSGTNFFADHTIALTEGEQYPIYVQASTSLHYCTFSLELSVLDGAKTVAETVNDNGKPFSVTALANISAYSQLYIGGLANPSSDVSNSFGDPEWVQTNPKTYVP
jgi:hypothetical protein